MKYVMYGMLFVVLITPLMLATNVPTWARMAYCAWIGICCANMGRKAREKS